MKWPKIAVFTLLTFGQAGSLCAQPRSAPLPPPLAASAARDSTRFLPRWVRPWIEFGGGWVAGPSEIKRHFESGQALAAGLEARPRSRWALRTALDYQMLLANGMTRLYLYNPTGTPGVYTVDSIDVATQTTGWIVGSRTEVGTRLPGDFWLTAGVGGGYMHSGLVGNQNVAFTDLTVPTSGEVANGWGWLWTAAMRYDFTPDPRVPLGLDVRTSELRRGHDAVRTWSVRLCYRVPAASPHDRPRRSHR